MNISRRVLLKLIGWISILIPFARRKAQAQYNLGSFWMQPEGAGDLYTMGDTETGEPGLGLATTTTPRKMSSDSWVQVCAHPRGDFTLAIKGDRTLWGWGQNDYYQITSVAGSVSSPVQIPGSWLQVAAGPRFAVGLKMDGTAWGWGTNTSGLLGTAATSSTSPSQIAGSWSMLQVGGAGATGYYSTYGIKTDGTLWAWGDNSNMQLADGGTTSSTSPKQIAGSWTMINSGGDWINTADCVGPGFGINAAGLKTDGTMWVWGLNQRGQIGDGTTTSYSNPVQKAPVYTKPFAADGVRGGIRADSTLWLSGVGEYGLLGQNTTSDGTYVIAGSWSQVVGGTRRVFAINTNKQMYAWGFNYEGALGVDTQALKVASPIQISGSWNQVTTGRLHSAGISSTGELYTWGCASLVSFGRTPIGHQLGYWPAIAVASKVVGYTKFLQVAKGPMAAHCVAIDQNGALWGWGKNNNYQLGSNVGKYVTTPTPLGITGVTQVAVGADYTTYIAGGFAYGMGASLTGVLGTFGTWTTPSYFGTSLSWVQIVAGGAHNLAVAVSVTSGVSTYQAYGWGDNAYSQSKGGTPDSGVSAPRTMTGPDSSPPQVFASETASAVLKPNGTLWAWGSWQTGVNISSPTQIPGSWTQFALGTGIAYGAQADGSYYKFVNSVSPTAWAPGVSFTQMVAGCSHFLGKQGDALWGWGSNDFGQLGTINSASSPVQISGSWGQVAAGVGHTVMIKK